MTTKEYLALMDQLKTLIRIKKRQAEALRIPPGITAPLPAADRVVQTKNVHYMDERIAGAVDAEREAEALELELIRVKQELIAAIDRLKDPTEALMITEYCLGGMNTEDIAEEHHYSRRRVQQILKSGTEHLDAILAERENISPDFAGFHLIPRVDGV